MKGGVFRGAIAAIALVFSRLNPWRVKTNHHPDPLLQDPFKRDRSRNNTKQNSSKQGSRRLGVPPCEPGTITYHDKLVRAYGRRDADHIEFLRRDETFAVRPDLGGVGHARYGWPTDISADDFIEQYLPVSN